LQQQHTLQHELQQQQVVLQQHREHLYSTQLNLAQQQQQHMQVMDMRHDSFRRDMTHPCVM